MTYPRRPRPLEYGLIDRILTSQRNFQRRWPRGLTAYLLPFFPPVPPTPSSTMPIAPQRSLPLPGKPVRALGVDIYNRLGVEAHFSSRARKSTTGLANSLVAQMLYLDSR